MSREGHRKWYTIKLADHAKTVVVHAEHHALRDVVRNMRKIDNTGHFSKVNMIKVKGIGIERLRKTLGAEFFDKRFEVQAEYSNMDEQYLILRSNNKSLPVGRPVLFSSPPVQIRPKRIEAVVA